MRQAIHPFIDSDTLPLKLSPLPKNSGFCGGHSCSHFSHDFLWISPILLLPWVCPFMAFSSSCFCLIFGNLSLFLPIFVMMLIPTSTGLTRSLKEIIKGTLSRYKVLHKCEIIMLWTIKMYISLLLLQYGLPDISICKAYCFRTKFIMQHLKIYIIKAICCPD